MMKLSRAKRTVVIFILLFSLFSLLVYGGIDSPPAPELGAYPGAYHIAEEPDIYQNQQVSFVAQVVSTDPVMVQSEYGTAEGVKSTQLHVTDIDATVERGDRLQIFGVLINPQTVQARNVVVVPQSGLWYAWVTSFIAGLWVLGRIVRHWRIDLKNGAFVPRSEISGLIHRGDD